MGRGRSGEKVDTRSGEREDVADTFSSIESLTRFNNPRHLEAGSLLTSITFRAKGVEGGEEERVLSKPHQSLGFREAAQGRLISPRYSAPVRKPTLGRARTHNAMQAALKPRSVLNPHRRPTDDGLEGDIKSPKVI